QSNRLYQRAVGPILVEENRGGGTRQCARAGSDAVDDEISRGECGHGAVSLLNRGTNIRARMRGQPVRELRGGRARTSKPSDGDEMGGWKQARVRQTRPAAMLVTIPFDQLAPMSIIAPARRATLRDRDTARLSKEECGNSAANRDAVHVRGRARVQ